MPTKKIDARERLLAAATDLFVAEGFDSVSVRDITAAADTTVNMVNYYFGSKQGLYDEIIGTLSEEVFMGPLKILESEPKTHEELTKCIEQYADATLDALIAQRKQYILASREKVNRESMNEFQSRFVAFIEAAKNECLIREDVDAEMLSGLIIGRLASQVIDADWIKKVTGVNISDTMYRRRWLRANLDLFFRGMLTAE